MLITVTAACIKGARKRDSSRCPVARAFRAAGFKKISVGGTEVEGIYPDGARFDDTALPKKAQEFIERYDDGAEVRPFSFRFRSQA